MNDNEQNHSVHISEYTDELVEKIKKQYETQSGCPAMKTGLIDLDYMLGGIRMGEVTIIGSRPIMGKTMFAVNIANEIAKNQKKKVVYNCDPLFSLHELEQMCSEKVVDLVVIDSLDKINFYGDAVGKNGTWGTVVNKLKKIAETYKVAILVLTTLMDDVDGREDKRPQIQDFRYVDLESDFDNLIGLYRDEHYNQCTDMKRIMEIIILKNSKGKTGTCLTAFMPELYKIKDLVKYKE